MKEAGRSNIERFLALSEKQKQAEIDKAIASPGKPLTATQRKRWSSIRRDLRMGWPKIGLGSELVPVSIERGLLAEADAWAKAHRLKRSQMIAQGLRMLMKRAG